MNTPLAPTRKQLLAVPVQDNGEPLVNIADVDKRISFAYLKEDMLPYTGESFYVRKSVGERLRYAQDELENTYPSAHLHLAYTYRHPEVQKKYFEFRVAQLQEKHPDWDDEAVFERGHLLAADPAVAGHPTGGAVDLTIVDSEGSWDMGSTIALAGDEHLFPTYADGVNQEQIERRLVLHDCMQTAGFAPFYEEWWHFSYGDREWAYSTGQQAALYDQITLESQN